MNKCRDIVHKYVHILPEQGIICPDMTPAYISNYSENKILENNAIR